MKSGTVASAVKATAALFVLAGALGPLAGCATDGPEEREAIYPEAIGYTPPSLADASESPPPVQAGEIVSGEVVVGASDDDGEPTYDDVDPSALTDFRGALDPYGTWMDDPTYGTVWVPSPSVVGPDFTPYVSAGHWDYDDSDGYSWASDYDWGWAPFHYGRWTYAGGAGRAGWEWVPGRTYAGAWVSWRSGSDYVGWAPLPPTWGWRGGVAVGLGFVPRTPYAFVGTRDLFAPSVGARVLAGAQVGAIAAHTTPYVSPSSGRVGAHPTVGGPTPGSLHIPPSAVARATAGDARGLAQARAFARPSTATRLGARAPAPRYSRAAPSRTSTGPARTAPAYRSASESHFGGKLGYGFAGSVTSARPAPAYRASARPYFAAPSRAPSYEGARSSYAARPQGAPPSGFGAREGGFHGAAATGGGLHGAAPAGGDLHGGRGGGGGFHGGGGRGGRR